MNNPVLKKITIIALIAASFAFQTNKMLSVSYKNNSLDTNKVLIGFNQNWTFLPPLDNPVFINNIRKLSPAILRYPGGTVTHGWNWRTGKFNKFRPTDFVHPIGDVKKLIDDLGVKFVFDLDVVNSSVQDQIAMLDSLHSLGVPIEFIELGNELYAANHGYEVPFPDGTAYADTVNAWVPKLRHAYPNAKIAAVHIGKTSDKPRQSTWNEKVTKGIKDIDAFTYHIYIDEGKNFEARKTRFLAAYYNPQHKSIWFTEYGNMNAYTKDDYLSELNKLANYVETFPGAKIVLNHTLVTNKTDRTKLERSTKGNTFSAEGEFFIKRARLRK